MIKFEIGDLVRIVNTNHTSCNGNIGILTTSSTSYIPNSDCFWVSGRDTKIIGIIGKKRTEVIGLLFKSGKFHRANHNCEKDDKLELLCKKNDITKERIQMIKEKIQMIMLAEEL